MAAFILMEEVVNSHIRRERIFRDRSEPLDALTDDELLSRYRFPRRAIVDMADRIDGRLRPVTARNHAIPTHTQVLVTLRYLAKADFLSEVGDLHGISKSSVSRIIPRVCKAICTEVNNINFPTDVEETRSIKQQFYRKANFSNCVGAVDGTLIPIQGMSGDDEPAYVCRKNFHALNIQGVVDAKMRFIHINCKYPGASHDAFVYMNSSLPEIIQNLPEGGWLLGDSGYPLRDNLMTPFGNPSNQTEINYNTAYARTRNVVERAFGVLKSRFRCLHQSGGCLPYKPLKCSKIIETCFRLHNKAIHENIPLQADIVNHHVDDNHVYQGEIGQSAQQRRSQLALRFI